VLDPKKAAESLKTVQRNGVFTVGALWPRYLSTLSEQSLRLARSNWENRLSQYFGGLSPHEMTRDKLATWQRDLQKRGYAPKTISNAYNHLAGCIRIAIDAGELDELPWGAVSRHFGGSGWRPEAPIGRKTKQLVGSIEQAMTLLRVAKEHDQKAWQHGKYSAYAASVAFLMLSGLRQAEACAVGWDCVEIDREPHVMRVLGQAPRNWWKNGAKRPREPTKTKKERSQILHPSLVEVLKAHRSELRRRGWYRIDGPLFPAKDGQWRRSAMVIKPEKMKEFAAKAGFPMAEDWVTHSLRHSFASLEVKSSGDLKRTQARTGHADVRQLEGYLHATGDFLGHSAIPLLPIRVEPERLLSDGETALIQADPWGFEMLEQPAPVERLTAAAARRYDDEVRDANRELRDRSEMSFADLAAEWLQRPTVERSGVPPEVTAAATRNYHQAYSAAKRQGCKPLECKKAAARKRRACLGAWARCLTIAERRVSSAIDNDST
jgi:integrase